VLKWICERVEGTGKAQKTAIGNLPTPEALDLSGLNLPAEDVQTCCSAVDVPVDGRRGRELRKFGSHLPKALNDQLDGLRKRLPSLRQRLVQLRRVLAAAARVVRLAAAFAADDRRNLLDDFSGLHVSR
jgi:hypothetical protein